MRLTIKRLRTAVFGSSPPPARDSTPNPVVRHGIHSIASPLIFNPFLKQMQRDRVASVSNARAADYVKEEVAARLCDRLLDLKTPTLNRVLDLGAGSGYIARHLPSPQLLPVGELVMLDSSRAQLYRDVVDPSSDTDGADQMDYGTLNSAVTGLPKITRVVGDEEALPFEEGSFDAVLSSCRLHWINDLPGTLAQVNKVLRQDGVFIGALLGGDTLYELRTCLQLAETERIGGIGAHVSPMVNVREVGSLLSRTSFALTTVDVDELVVDYPSIFELMQDLQLMGESNAILGRTKALSKDVLAAAAAIYLQVYGNPDGSIPATFQIIYMIGWKPDAKQPKPLKPGSGKVPFLQGLSK